MNGYELARQLRQHQAFEDVLLIAMTGLGDPDNLRLAREAGFAHHLLKPYIFGQLRELLETLPRKVAGCG
jgi:CheY-like chemotaxis protein